MVNILSDVSYAAVMHFPSSTGDELIRLDSTGIHFRFFQTTVTVDVTVTINDGFWHHVCITWSSTVGAWVCYLDGVAVQQGSGHGTGNTINGE